MHLLGKFIGQINRNDIYITTKLEPIIQQQNDIEKQLDTYLSLL